MEGGYWSYKFNEYPIFGPDCFLDETYFVNTFSYIVTEWNELRQTEYCWPW